MSPRQEDGLTQLTRMMQSDGAPSRASVDPEVRRRRRIRGGVAAAIVVVVILALVGGYVGYALNAPVGAADATTQVPTVASPAAASVVASPEGSSAMSVISGGEKYLPAGSTGTWVSGGDAGPLPIASISKLITAMVVLSAKPLGVDDPGPTITFSKADHDLYDKYYVLGATIAAMPTGTRMSQHDALALMLVGSASNYGEAVAGWAFGSQGAYVSATRKWLAANGLTSTTIVEPTGLDPRNTSTTTDMLALARLAVADPLIRELVALPRISVAGIADLTNTNDLLGSSGITGLKTGNLEESGFNLLFSATFDVGLSAPITVVGVVLGGFSRATVDNDVRAMLGGVTAGFHRVEVAASGQVVGSVSTPWGESAQLVLKSDATLLTWSDTAITATLDTTTPQTGVDGEVVGQATFTDGVDTVTVPVLLKGTIKPPDPSWRLTHPFELGG